MFFLINLVVVLFSGVVAQAGYFGEPEFQPLKPQTTITLKTIGTMNAQNPAVAEVFKASSDLSALSDLAHKRPQRIGFGGVADSANMLGLSIQLERGVITKGTLVVHDSGHSIPVAAYFMREFSDEFKIQTVLHLPRELNQDPKVARRLAFHTGRWGKELADLQARHANQGAPDVVFFGIEAHRTKKRSDYFLHKLSTEDLPDTEELRSIGITNVVFLTEAHPDADFATISYHLRADTKAYLDSLELPVTYYGNDCRRDVQCYEIIGMKHPHGKDGIF